MEDGRGGSEVVRVYSKCRFYPLMHAYCHFVLESYTTILI